MKVLFWNMMGLGVKGRRRQLRELVSKHIVDVLCL
jgi:hypothetical protein